MKKIALLSVLTSALLIAGGGYLEDVEPITPMIKEVSNDTSTIPMSVAYIGGVQKGEGDNVDWEVFQGFEFSFACLLSDSVRSQLQITTYDQNDIAMLQISANPHYIFNVTEKISLGSGPHLGLARVEIGTEDDIVFTYGLGASARMDITEHFFVGAEARYEWSTDATFGGVDDDFNNAKVFGKIGYSF
ncbi:MAG: porin family protein [Sulfurovum sp.]|nr:porin family protein [Sulfurovum sp.]